MLDNLEKISPLSELVDIPKADVVEKEKINKAIEEIQKLRGCSSDGIIDDVEDILDKLIESGE